MECVREQEGYWGAEEEDNKYRVRKSHNKE